MSKSLNGGPPSSASSLSSSVTSSIPIHTVTKIKKEAWGQTEHTTQEKKGGEGARTLSNYHCELSTHEVDSSSSAFFSLLPQFRMRCRPVAMVVAPSSPLPVVSITVVCVVNVSVTLARASVCIIVASVRTFRRSWTRRAAAARMAPPPEREWRAQVDSCDHSRQDSPHSRAMSNRYAYVIRATRPSASWLLHR